MARCGCSNPGVLGCLCTLVDSDCLDANGAGTTGSPYTLTPILSAASGQLLTCGVNGLAATYSDVKPFVRSGGIQSINNNSETAFALTNDTFDDFNLHDTVTLNTRLVADRLGLWLCFGEATFLRDADGIRYARLRKGGSTYFAEKREGGVSSTDGVAVNVMAFVRLAATEYIELYVFQDSGAAMSVIGRLGMCWLGAY